MKKLLTLLAALTAAGIGQAQNVTNLFPNGNFALGGPTADWAEAQGGGFVFSYPASGGNPGQYAVIDGTNSTQWAVLVAGDTTPLPLGSLGIVPGGTYTFLQDMITLAGTNTGGLKIESWGPSGLISSSGDMRPGSWTTNGWATYSFNYTVSLSATGLKIVPLWGPGSTVGFDNLGVVAPASTPLFAQITSPADSSTVSTNFLIVVSTGVVPGSVTNVDFYRGATLIGSDTSLPFSLNVTGAALGAAALKVVAMDDNGGTVTSSVVNVTVTGGAAPTNTFVVDPFAAWSAFMNVRNTPQNGNGYVFGSPWGAGALTAEFSGVGPSSVLTLKPGTAPGDSSTFWLDYTVEPLLSNPSNFVGAVGFKEMEASYYVQVPDGSVSGNVVVFKGSCKTNTLDITLNPGSTNGIGNGWTNYAFVKDFAPDYSSSVDSFVALTSGVPFSVSLATIPDPARHVQYGFVTRGPNVWQTDVNNYGVVQINSLDVSPTNVVVNHSSSWLGFMNVFNKPQDGGGYQFGSGWGTADLCAVFNGSGLVLSPNVIGDPNSYWYTPSGGPGSVGNKTMDASMYVEIGSLPGRKLIFSGNVLSNTLVSASNTNALGNGWTSVAFIKDYAPDYSSFNSATVPLTPGAFSINLNTINDPARHVQYGFETVGPNVWVTDVAPFGNVIIGNAGTLPTSINASAGGSNINLAFASQLGKVYTVQYKNNLPDASWLTLTTTNGTGSNIVISDPTSGSKRFYRLSIQ
ncbi:MAG: hypothetical protein RLY20_215 [Verrucomicrobiota bacterium]|jgi:hypothetical protein